MRRIWIDPATDKRKKPYCNCTCGWPCGRVDDFKKLMKIPFLYSTDTPKPRCTICHVEYWYLTDKQKEVWDTFLEGGKRYWQKDKE
jgi:hypothetical protein